MKKLLLFTAVTAAISTAYGQTTIFEDNFESYSNFIISDIGQYQLFDNDRLGTYIGGITTQTGVPPWANAYAPMVCQVFNPSVAKVQNGHDNENSNFDPHGGSKYLAFWAASPDNGVTKNDDWLVLPQLTLGTGNKLTFWVKSLATDYGLEKYRVAIYDGTAAPTSSASFQVIGATSRTAPITWTEVSVDIPATYNNKPVYLAINYISADVYMMMVDDLKVTATTLAVTETAKQNTTVFPNPSKGIFNLKSSKKATSVAVYSADGRMIKQEKSAELLDITGQPKGVYILKINYEDGTTESSQLLKQ